MGAAKISAAKIGAGGPRDLGPYQVLGLVARDRWSETFEALGPAEPSRASQPADRRALP